MTESCGCYSHAVWVYGVQLGSSYATTAHDSKMVAWMESRRYQNQTNHHRPAPMSEYHADETVADASPLWFCDKNYCATVRPISCYKMELNSPFYASIMSTLVRSLPSMDSAMSGKTRRLSNISTRVLYSGNGVNLHRKNACHNQYVGIDVASLRCVYEYEQLKHSFE